MGKNDYLARRDEDRQKFFNVGEEMGIQKAWDYIQIVLRDPEVMGKNVMGVNKLKKVYTKLAEVAEHYKFAFSDHVEADFYQEELDRVLKEIWGDELVVFKDRYPYIKEASYSRGKKAWR